MGTAMVLHMFVLYTTLTHSIKSFLDTVDKGIDNLLFSGMEL